MSAPLRTSVVLATLALGLASTARADVVMPARTDCPRGAVGTSSHAGPHCAPTACVASSSCETFRGYDYRDAIFECLEAGLCVRTQTGFSGRGGRREHTVAIASCTSTDGCPADSRCEVASRCVQTGSHPRDPNAVAQAPRPTASGCTAAATSAVLLLAFLCAGATFTTRRARARGRATAVRALLASQGSATRSELEALVGRGGPSADRSIAMALAPLATAVRIDAGDDGELRYSLDDLARDDESLSRRGTS